MKTHPAICKLPINAVLGEGPVWDSERGRLWWVDIERGQLHSLSPTTGEADTYDLPHKIGFAIPTTSGDLILGTQRGLIRYDPSSRVLTPYADPEQHLPGNRFNDAKCDAAGRLWAGTLAMDYAPGSGTLYRVDSTQPDPVTPMVRDVTISNGIAWSGDGRTMFYIDSPTRRVDAFDFDPEAGELSGRRPVITFSDGYPDGMCIDVDGNLWVALWGGWRVACHSPTTGERIAQVEIPVEAVSSCCFGGENLDELFITTASRDLDDTGRKQQPMAGSVFVAKPGVRGTPTSLFRV